MVQKYDLVVIGGGSGGIAAANEAAKFGAKCAIIESKALGGTCVNLGCVPKKLMWLAGNHAHTLNHAHEWGFRATKAELDWPQLIEQREHYILRLNQLYENKLKSNKVDLYRAKGQLISNHVVTAGKDELQADNVILATGGSPFIPDLPGRETGLTSDGFFALKRQPKKVAIIGAGYIAVELAGLLNALGTQVHLVFRHNQFLRHFDRDIVEKLMEIYNKDGIHLHPKHVPIGVEETKPGVFCVNCQDQDRISGVDQVIWATGRVPNTQSLFADDLNIEIDTKGQIVVNEEQQTSIPNIFAVGDLTGQMALTPVAIAQGRRLARTLFNNQPYEKIDYQNIATVIFSHPPISSCGITEMQAKEQNIPIRCFNARFTPMTQTFARDPHPAVIKLIVHANTDRVLGCHLLGDGCDEIMQGFSVAMGMGATKKDFDSTIAIHPTLAEELVTLR